MTNSPIVYQGSYMGIYNKVKEAKEALIGLCPKYRILQADMMRGPEKENAAAITAFITTGEEAYKLAGHDGYRYETLDKLGRCGVVSYRGVETALLYKRQICEIEPGPADPMPEKVLNEPKDAWIHISLLGADNATKQKGISARLQQALDQNERLTALLASEEGDRILAEAKLKKLEDDRTLIAGMRDEIALLKESAKGDAKALKNLQKDLLASETALKEVKKNIVSEVFPVFNTLWLAGEHRQADELYTILKKQMTQALDRIGGSLIEPTLGQLFDPYTHNAIHSQELEEGAREVGCVTQVHKVGWKIGGKVASPANVTVGIEKKGQHDEPRVDEEREG